MDIRNKTVLILGAWGLVGNAITRKILKHKPSKLVLTSLREGEIKSYREKILKDYPDLTPDQVAIWWGDIFVREEFKDINRKVLLCDRLRRKTLYKDVLDELDENILSHSGLFRLIDRHKPDVIIDCINTATGIAYQDIYTTYKHIVKVLDNGSDADHLEEELERLLATLYIPQLIRHIQILYVSMKRVNTQAYMKIGTSGTGGYGLNIPYTHSEEKPSRVLLSKSAIGGAHSLMLFIMGRTPDSAITKEIKPTAAIAWKEIGYGEILKGGKPVPVHDIPFEKSVSLNNRIYKSWEDPTIKPNGTLKAVYIDTGENGVFSKGEFEALTAQGQMEFVTPEEIADAAIFEIMGGNTGHDIINALDNAALEPSYRAGYLQHSAIDKLTEIENMVGKESIAFEMIGPPRLSKLLIESFLIKKIVGDMEAVPGQDPVELSEKISELLREDDKLRNEILSIGIPILLPDGKRLLRGSFIKIPKMDDEDYQEVSSERIDKWAHDGWVDLRTTNFSIWTSRVKSLIEEAQMNADGDTSSMHVRTPRYWNNFKEIDIGKVVSWIFINEEHGKRMKA
jgi:hypothetical protein